ncbi:DUF2637 domain-containing protein [Streptomyces triticiradicis]|uniref:DUF2637 domain-containing protein n=1 Tax=Streptomyces triticiradicis TaxID=2651189 RepID=A0A7J5DCK3_9ACTN|nr:DUF2637 domain-containing protein [Streptomyces triticiradicis]KAB1986557.1 DUF2637 domain-containing protein [Streptomyces triticiradicis]
MNDDYVNLSFARYGQNSGHLAGTESGPYDDPVTTLHEQGWDPVEELTYLLQDAAAAEHEVTVPQPRTEAAYAPRAEAAYTPHVEAAYADEFAGDPMDDLVQITAELPPVRRSSAGHRKVRVRKPRNWLQAVSFAIAAIAAATVSMVSVFSGMVAYSPLQRIASNAQSGTGPWWPLLVYGPWTVASLSILRAALHQRRAVHSWYVVLLFSSVAMMFCVADAHQTVTGVATAVVPALASLTCFQQLVRQITLTRPPRQTVSRHRQRPCPAPERAGSKAGGAKGPSGVKRARA